LIDLPYINHTQDAKQDAKLRLSVWQNIKMKENALEHLFCRVNPAIKITGVLKMNFQSQGMLRLIMVINLESLPTMISIFTTR